jgi:hypothetical protein
MLKNKIITHSLCTMFFVAAPLAVAVTPGHAWNNITIDYETHNGNTDPAKGIYYENSKSWRTGIWPYSSINGAHRYLSDWQEGIPRIGKAFWYVKVPETGWYNLQTCYFQTENRTHDADYAVYVNTKTADVGTATPVYKVTIDQEGPVAATVWVNLGTYCLKKSDISMVVLDGNDNLSDDADASRWTFVGEEYQSKICGGGGKITTPIIKPLLLKDNK